MYTKIFVMRKELDLPTDLPRSHQNEGKIRNISSEHSALLLEDSHHGIPLSLTQLKLRIASSFRDRENQTCTIAKLNGFNTIEYYGVVGLGCQTMLRKRKRYDLQLFNQAPHRL